MPRQSPPAADNYRYTCDYCGEVVEAHSEPLMGKTVYWRGNCACPGAVKAQLEQATQESTAQFLEEYRQIIGAAGQMINEGRYARMTFANWDSTRHPLAAKHLQDVMEFTTSATAERNLLWLYGSYGRGKSHLALSAMRKMVWDGLSLKDIMRRYSACYTEWVMHCSKVQQSWDDDGEEKEGRLWAKMMRSTFLVIDDIDKSVPSEWAMKKLYEVVHYRYMRELTTIVTANHSVEQLGKVWLGRGGYVADIGGAILSRISGQLWAQVEIKGGDQRK